MGQAESEISARMRGSSQDNDHLANVPIPRIRSFARKVNRMGSLSPHRARTAGKSRGRNHRDVLYVVSALLLILLTISTVSAEPSSPASPSNAAPKGAGSGFYLAGSNGALVTAAHVVRDCAHILAKRSSGQFVALEASSIDVADDLALLRDSSGGHRVGLPIAKEVTPLLGEPVMTYGFGLFGPLHGEGSLLVGNVTGFGGLRLGTRAFNPVIIRISMDLKFGFSGAPVVDASGGIVGVASSVETIGLRGSNDSRNTVTLNLVAGGVSLQKFLGSSKISYSRLTHSRSQSPTTIAAAMQHATVPLFCAAN